MQTKNEPAVIQVTALRDAFHHAFHTQDRKSISKPLRDSVGKHLKRNAGRIFHKKGWYVTRRKGK